MAHGCLAWVGRGGAVPSASALRGSVALSSSETDMDTNHLRITDEELQADLDALQAEALGWLPLGDGAYLHAGGLAATRDDGVVVIDVVGVPTSAMAEMTVLLLT